MNTTDEQQASSAASPLPTGESQIGVVRRPAAPEADGPVLEHSVAVPQAAPGEPEAIEAAVEPAPAPEPAPQAQAAPAAPEAPAAPVRATPALQESPKVSIPERMNHLSTENQRLRDELQALEQSLKSTPE